MPFSFGEEQLNVNDMVTTLCTVNKGDFPIEITWYHKDNLGNVRKLTTDDGIIITRTNERISMLSIDQLKAKHRGNFTCAASNKAGKTQYSTNLLING